MIQTRFMIYDTQEGLFVENRPTKRDKEVH